jgi:hypothetical protein
MGRAPHRVFCSAVGAAAAAFGVTLALAPGISAALPSGTLPPLHARCIAAMHVALAVALWSARRRIDEAAARIPLALTATWGGAAVLAALAQGQAAAAPPWLAAAGATAAGAAWLGLYRAEEAVRAERADRGWIAVAAVGGVVAVLLLFAPAWTAARWPWRMGAAQAGLYGSPLLAFAAAAWLAAVERRRYVREPALHAWLALALGVLAASFVHRPLFDAARALTWVWFGAFGAVAAWAAARVAGRRPLRQHRAR